MNHPKLIAGPGEDHGHTFAPPYWLWVVARLVAALFVIWMGYLTYHTPVSPAPLFFLIGLIMNYGLYARD